MRAAGWPDAVVPVAVVTTGHARQAWQRGLPRPMAPRATVRELMCVLGDPKFELSAGEQGELLADYLPSAEVATIPGPPSAANSQS